MRTLVSSAVTLAAAAAAVLVAAPHAGAFEVVVRSDCLRFLGFDKLRDHTVALALDGTVWTTGRNFAGQLGHEEHATHYGQLRPVPGLAGVVDVAAGAFHSLATRADGTVWSWGSNARGQLGDGTTAGRRTPGLVPGLTDVVEVAAGYETSYARRSDGSVWAWGAGSFGALGDGGTAMRPVPGAVPGVGSAEEVAAFEHTAWVRRTDGSVVGWGRNRSRELGLASLADQPTAVVVPQLAGAANLADNGFGVVRADGTALAWSYHTAPRAVPGVSDAVAVSGGSPGGSTALVVRADGRVLMSGANSWGEAGNDHTGSATGIEHTEGLGGIVHIDATQLGVLALDSDGRAFAWNYNSSGELGLGARDYLPRPVQTGCPQGAPLDVTLLSPIGRVFAAEEHQVFEATMREPELDAVSLEVQVRDASGAVVRQDRGPLVRFNAVAYVRLPAPLGAGSYTWTARGVDAIGAAGDWSAPAAFSVARASDECGTPLYSGRTGGHDLHVRIDEDDQLTRAVCVRVDDPTGTAPGVGGKLVVEPSEISSPPEWEPPRSCADTSGNLVPPELGEWLFVSSREVWVCTNGESSPYLVTVLPGTWGPVRWVPDR